MDWKYASSLFIFVFLIMNLCLGMIYYNKVEQSKIIDTQYEKTISFKEKNIKLPTELPSVSDTKLNYVSGKSVKFTVADEKDKEAATITLSEIDNKIKLKSIEPSYIIKQLNSFMNIVPYEGKQYILSGIDRKNKKIYYEQRFGEYPILNNDRARIIFSYNDDNEVTRYKQTYMEENKESLGKNNDKKQVAKPKQALEALYYQNKLKSGDEVKAVRLGYYSVVRKIEGQVLKPMWQVAIQHKDGKRETFYVDALAPEEPIL